MRYFVILLIAFVILVPSLAQQSELPPADINNPEGGPVSVAGEVRYTNPLFTNGVAAPLVIMEDQTGFVDRDRGFVMSVESQTLGQITSDFFTSPFTYSLALPIEPVGEYRDVDNDGSNDQGVQIFAIAYWANVWGDPFLEERDLFGGGWSSAYASTLVIPSAEVGEAGYEYEGGKLLIYSPDDQQGFPSDLAPMASCLQAMNLPFGYHKVIHWSIWILARSPLTVRVIHESISWKGRGAEADDFSNLSYTDAFDAMIDKLRRRVRLY